MAERGMAGTGPASAGWPTAGVATAGWPTAGLATAGLYGRLVGAQIRSEWQYRTSFLLFTVAQATVTALEFSTILILFQAVPDLGGWTASQVVLLYGLAAVPFALTDVVVSPVETLSTYVRTGTFDRLLLRPVPPLVQICALRFELRRVGKLVPATAALAWGMVAVDVEWGPAEVGLVVLALSCGAVVYTGLWIATASMSFWAVATQQAGHAFTFGGQFANEYPLHVYPRWVRAVLGWIVPLAFVAYVPALTILDAPNPLGLPSWLVALSPAVAAAALVVAMGIWRLGIRHYQGTGS